MPEIRAKTWGGCLAMGGWSTSLLSELLFFDPGGTDDRSKIVVVGAHVGGGQSNAEDQPSRWGGWDTGAQGYCHNWKRINCFK